MAAWSIMCSAASGYLLFGAATGGLGIAELVGEFEGEVGQNGTDAAGSGR